MERSGPHDAFLTAAPPAAGAAPPAAKVDRRRFLLQLGVLAGAGALPFASRLGPPGRPRRLEVARPALGTWVRVVAVDDDPARAARGVEAAFAAIRRVDGQMSIHRADSQLARVNAAAGERSVRVDPAVVEVVSRACAASRWSGGVYDPTILPLMKLYGFYGAARDRYPTDREIASALEITGSRHVAIDPAARTVGITRRRVGLDLGSIGKGWALDEAVGAMRNEGIGSALVDVGGNVYGLGAPEERSEGWTVGVLHPATGRIDRTLVLRDRAVATSGDHEQFRVLGGERVGHLLDASRGRPADGPLSVSVEASSGVGSDLLSTIGFLLGPDRFRGHPGALRTHFIG